MSTIWKKGAWRCGAEGQGPERDPPDTTPSKHSLKQRGRCTAGGHVSFMVLQPVGDHESSTASQHRTQAAGARQTVPGATETAAASSCKARGGGLRRLLEQSQSAPPRHFHPIRRSRPLNPRSSSLFRLPWTDGQCFIQALTVTVTSGHLWAIMAMVGPPTYPAPMQQMRRPFCSGGDTIVVEQQAEGKRRGGGRGVVWRRRWW